MDTLQLGFVSQVQENAMNLKASPKDRDCVNRIYVVPNSNQVNLPRTTATKKTNNHNKTPKPKPPPSEGGNPEVQPEPQPEAGEIETIKQEGE